MRVAFVGLGIMGYPMAGHLKAAGHDVTVFNRTTSKAEAWCEQYAGDRAATPAAAAENAGIVFSAGEWMRKDLNIALQAAADNGASLEMTQLIDEFYAEIEARGGRRWDTSSLIARLER